MTENLKIFRHDASAFWNARDWAKKKRDEFIKSANERHVEICCLMSQWQTGSDAILILNKSDVSNSIRQSSITTHNEVSRLQSKKGVKNLIRLLTETPKGQELAPLVQVVRRGKRLLDSRTENNKRREVSIQSINIIIWVYHSLVLG